MVGAFPRRGMFSEFEPCQSVINGENYGKEIKRGKYTFTSKERYHFNFYREDGPREFDVGYSFFLEKSDSGDPSPWMEGVSNGYSIGEFMSAIQEERILPRHAGTYILQMTKDPLTYIYGKTSNIINRIRAYRTHLPKDFRIVAFSGKFRESDVESIIKSSDHLEKIKRESFCVKRYKQAIDLAHSLGLDFDSFLLQHPLFPILGPSVFISEAEADQ